MRTSLIYLCDVLEGHYALLKCRLSVTERFLFLGERNINDVTMHFLSRFFAIPSHKNNCFEVV